MSKNLSMIGGAKGGGGAQHVPIIAPDSTRSTAIVEVVEAWGWGEIEGFPGADPLEYVYLDGVPVKSNGVENFKGITFDYRLGTQDQTYIPGVVDDAVGSPEIVDVPVTHDTPITRTVTDPSTDAVRVIIIFQALVVQNTTNGDRYGASVDLQIEVRPAGGAWTIIDLQGRDKVRDKTEAAYQRSYHVNLRAVAASASSYDIRVTRLSADPGNGDQSAFRWSSYTKLTYAKLRRPNIPHCRITFDARYFSSIPVRSYLLRGWRIQVPTVDVYNPIARTYTGADWSGTLSKSWCRNPAWFLYHLLTTAGAGLGEDINPAYQDKWAIYQIAKRCDELVPDGKGGTEPRYSIDAQFMAQSGAHEMIQSIAGIFDAQALWDGKSVYLTQDAPKPVSALYLPANVVDGRFTYAGTGRQVRYTAALIQYNDPTDQYKLTTEYVEDFYAIQRYGYRPKTETALGCTSRGEAHRRGKRLLVTGREETDAVTFAVGMSGINNKPGDIIRIADPLRSTGKRLGGRISKESTAALINLDAPVMLASGISYRLAVVGADGTVWDRAVVNAAGSHDAIVVSPAFAAAPEHELEWIIYDPLAIGQQFRLLGIADNDDKSSGFYTISATQYAPDKFAEIDDVADLGSLTENPFAIHTGVLPASGLVVTDGVYTDLEGVRRYLDISWSASPDPLLYGYQLSYICNGQPVVTQEVYGQSYRIDNPLIGDYDIYLAALNVLGAQSSTISTTYSLLKLFAVADTSIINLGVKGAGLEFVGRNAECHWETDADVALNLPPAYSAGKGGATRWFRDFEINIFTADGETLLRTDYCTETAYSYTFEKNVEDGGPRRIFKVEVAARDEFGNYSASAAIVPYNTPPQAGAVIESIPRQGSISLKITPPDDPDYSYVRLFASKTAGFTPELANQIYQGSESYITFPIDPDDAGNWYLRAQFVDEFGVDGAIYSGEASQTVTAIVADLDPVVASEIYGAIVDFNAANNRNGSAVVAPTIATNGTAIDHVLNANGSIDMSVEWSWSGDEGDIDGFGVYAHASTSVTPYTFNGTSPDEVVFQLPASSRAYIHHGLPAFRNDFTGGQDRLYYTLGVVAYRKVDKDIAPSGVIASDIIQPTVVGENPYCPATAVAGTGDITSTIDGIDAVNVNRWEFITGDGRPWDNADVTKDQLSGSGVNILNSRYALIEEASIPPYVVTGGAVTLNNDAAQFNLSVLRLTATGPLAELYLSGASTDYNFILTPNKKWLVSAYVRSAVANASGSLLVRASNGAYVGVEFLTSPTPNNWTRVSGVIDLSANASALGLLKLENDAGVGIYIDFTGLMLEEQIGNIIAPSAFARPALGSIAGVTLDKVADAVNNYNLSNDRNDTAITAPTVAADNTALDYSTNTDGSVNISFEWSWSGDEAEIDGFAILAYSTSTNHGTYVFGTQPSQEFVIQVPADRRAYIANGVPADAYYTVAVCAYRSVAKDIAANGIINSVVVYANGSTERPFRPLSTVQFNGNVAGTVAGKPAAEVAAATGAVDSMLSDSVISAAEKRAIRVAWNAIADEYQGFVNQATGYQITAEKTTYMTAFQALGDFLNGSTWTIGAVPAGIDDAHLDTDFVVDENTAVTFRIVSNAYYSAKAALLKKLIEIAPTKSTAADTSKVGGILSTVVLSDVDKGVATFDETVTLRTIEPPTNAPTYPTYTENPTPIQISAQSAGGAVDVTIHFVYTQATSPSLPADGFTLFRYTGAFSFASAVEVSTSNSPLTRALVHNAVPIDTGYNYAVAAFRRTVGAGEDSKIFSSVATGWVKESGVANVGLVATETADFRIVQVATNNPTVQTPISIEAKTSGSYAGVDVHLYWDYTQGTLKADLIGFEIWDSTTLTYRPVGVNVTPSQGRAVFQGLVAGREYKFALHTIRNTSGGPQLGTRVTGWDITPTDALGITGKVNGETAATIASSTQFITAFTADNKLTYKEKLALRDNLWASITGEYSDLVAQGTAASVSTTAYTAAYNTLNTYFNVTTRTMTSSGVGGSTTLFHAGSMTYTHDIPDGVALRGYVATYYTAKEALKNALRDKAKTTANWSGVTNDNALKPADSANNTYVVNGIVYGVSTGAGTAVGNNLVTISSNGTLNGAGGGQVTAAGIGAAAVADLATKLNNNAANVLSGSVALKTSGYDGGNGVAITSNGIAAKKAGVDTFVIASDGTAAFSGKIQSGYGEFSAPQINPAVFGSYTVSCAGYSGNCGTFGSGNMWGVYGQSSQSSAVAVRADNPYGGVGLGVSGSMTINNSALITNLNANYLNSLSPGNSSGQIAVSNGTTCTNLNANYLQGYSASSFILAGSSINASTLSGYAWSDFRRTGVNIPASEISGAITATYLGTFTSGDIPKYVYAAVGSSWLTVSSSWFGIYAAAGSGLTTYISGQAVYIGTTSDRKLKKEIEPETLGLEFINKLQPVSYRLRSDDALLQHGFIAQDVAEHFSGVNVDALYTEHNDVKAVGYIPLIGPLVKAVQDLTAELNQLKSQLEGK